MTSYFCYQCRCQKQSSDISLETTMITCKTCGSEFVEECIAENQSETMQQQQQQQQQGAVGGFDSFQPFGHFGHSLQDDPLLRPLPHYRPTQQQQAALEGELFGAMPVFRFGINRMFHMDTQALDNLMTHLLSQVDNVGASPPATQQQLARIRKVGISAGQVTTGIQCCICLDEFKEGDMAEMLPCEHHFHSQCIRPWLDRRDTCPVCRKPLSLPGDQQTSAAPVSGAEAMAEAMLPEFTHFGGYSAYSFSQVPPATGHGPSAPGGRGRRGGGGGGGSGGGHDRFVEDACD